MVDTTTTTATSDIVMNILSQIGYAGPLTLLIIIIVFSLYSNTPESLKMSPQTYIAIILIWQIANIFLNMALKQIIKEPRPPNTQSINSIDAIKTANDYGMPSGHTQLVFSQLTFIALILKNKLLTFIAFLQAIFTVIQRYYYKKHTALQLTIGAMIGILTGIITSFFIKKQKKQ